MADAHSWFTDHVPALVTVTIPRQPFPPHESVPGSFGFPAPSAAMFHISAACALCVMLPMNLCRSSARSIGVRTKERWTGVQVVHVPLYPTNNCGQRYSSSPD